MKERKAAEVFVCTPSVIKLLRENLLNCVCVGERACELYPVPESLVREKTVTNLFTQPSLSVTFSVCMCVTLELRVGVYSGESLKFNII